VAAPPRKGNDTLAAQTGWSFKVAQTLKNQRVRRWPGRRLPFVAEGSIPLIYRHAYFTHRATPQ